MKQFYQGSATIAFFAGSSRKRDSTPTCHRSLNAKRERIALKNSEKMIPIPYANGKERACLPGRGGQKNGIARCATIRSFIPSHHSMMRRIAPLAGATFFLIALGLTAASAQQVPPPDGSPPLIAPLPPGCTLKISDIDGEGPGGTMFINSFSWGESNTTVGGIGVGKVQMQDFHFTKLVDKASPKLFLAVASGQHFKNTVLTCRNSSDPPQEYLRWTFTDVLMSAFQHGGNGTERPTESLSLNFAKIEFQYRPQNPDGSLGTAVKEGWDLKKNVKG